MDLFDKVKKYTTVKEAKRTGLNPYIHELR